MRDAIAGLGPTEREVLQLQIDQSLDTGEIASVLAIPSTDMQLILDLAATELRFDPQGPCFAVHVLAGGRIVSHIQPVARPYSTLKQP